MEIKARRGNSSNQGKGRGVNKPQWDNSNKTLEHIGQALWEWSNKRMEGTAQGVFNKYNKSGKLLECFRCGNTSHLMASCPKEQ